MSTTAEGKAIISTAEYIFNREHCTTTKEVEKIENSCRKRNVTRKKSSHLQHTEKGQKTVYK